MSASSTFKQRCPTCGEMAPVKVIQIGKKVKCPLCMAAFVAEKPAEEPAEDDGLPPAPAAKKGAIKTAVAGAKAKAGARPSAAKPGAEPARSIAPKPPVEARHETPRCLPTHTR